MDGRPLQRSKSVRDAPYPRVHKSRECLTQTAGLATFSIGRVARFQVRCGLSYAVSVLTNDIAHFP